MVGRSLAHYEILEPLGVGGMGEVYRARDTKLNRDVAIKVLPEAFAEDEQRMGRFQREARVLASLNHPNIGSIYGLEESGTTRALVLELVEGPTLGDRLRSGLLETEQALSIGLQVAEALEAAHESGIVHRDLKPNNVKALDESGRLRVKVLDFGLAKAFAGETEETSQPDSPTLSVAATKAGVILGTAAYMSPEQARGVAVDKRADIWSFGVVLFEMLSGRQLFGGETVSDTLADVLRAELDWKLLPSDTSPAVRRLLRRCLERDPLRRLRDIGEARVAIEEVLRGEADVEEDAGAGIAAPGAHSASAAAAAVPGGGSGLFAAISSSPARAVALVTAIGAIALIAGLFVGRTFLGSEKAGDEAGAARFSIALPTEAVLLLNDWPAATLAISPDGSRLVYKGEDRTQGFGSTALSLRDLDSLELRRLAGTEQPGQPFFSPDSEWLAFFDYSGNMKKLNLAGGEPVTVVRDIVGSQWAFGSWGDNGDIVYAPWDGGLFTVDADGGQPRPLTEPVGESHAEPTVLPGSLAVIYTAYTTSSAEIRVLNSADGTSTTLLTDAAHAQYLASGHLLFTRDGALLVAPFDPLTLEITGPAVSVPLDLRIDEAALGYPRHQLAASRNGTLLYAPAPEGFMEESTLVWVTRDGKEEEIARLQFRRPALDLAPDGSRLLVTDRQGGETVVQIFDLQRRTLDTFARNRQPYLFGAIWAADGSILWAESQQDAARLFRRRPGGAAPEELLVREGVRYLVPSSSLDGKLALAVYSQETAGDLWILDLDGDRGAGPQPFELTASHDSAPMFSPDGGWIAYQTYGAEELIYLQRYPEGGDRRVVARGQCPRWSPSGNELFFLRRGIQASSGEGLAGVQLYEVSVQLEPEVTLGDPQLIFDGPFFNYCTDGAHSYDVSPDGSRLLMLRLEHDRTGGRELGVVINWFEELERLAPPGR